MAPDVHVPEAFHAYRRPAPLPAKWDYLALHNLDMKQEIGAVASEFRRSDEVARVAGVFSTLHHYQGAGRFQTR